MMYVRRDMKDRGLASEALPLPRGLDKLLLSLFFPELLLPSLLLLLASFPRRNTSLEGLEVEEDGEDGRGEEDDAVVDVNDDDGIDIIEEEEDDNEDDAEEDVDEDAEDDNRGEPSDFVGLPTEPAAWEASIPPAFLTSSRSTPDTMDDLSAAVDVTATVSSRSHASKVFVLAPTGVGRYPATSATGKVKKKLIAAISISELIRRREISEATCTAV